MGAVLNRHNNSPTQALNFGNLCHLPPNFPVPAPAKARVCREPRARVAEYANAIKNPFAASSGFVIERTVVNGADTMTETPATQAVREDARDEQNVVIRARNLEKTVESAAGPLHILKGIDLHIKAGESVAVIGASGSGKSTLLGLLAGLDLPSAGSVWLGGREITTFDEDQRAQARAELVGFVFQSFQLLPSLTALENVMLPLELGGQGGARAAAATFLERVGLGARQQHYPRQLSGGEQQRVAIARAFASTPRILFADEPTGNLDTATGAHIIDLLFELNREARTTLVLVTHENRLAERCARRIELAAGAIIADSGETCDLRAAISV